jgi:UDP-N-acetylmuramyl pentapeptide phosphotransferase/UDP-N-acetylglucosamine-1-phosphate transferase
VLELVVGLLVTAGLAPVVRTLMLRHGFLDIPNPRSSHTVPTPRAGGIACLGGLVATVTAAAIVGQRVS